MSKKKDWKDPKDYLIEAYTNKLINDYKQDDEKEQERQRQRALSSPSTSNTTNSPTSSQNSPQTSSKVSQSTPAERDLFKITGRRHTVTDRRRGIDKNEKTQRTGNISGQNRGLSRDGNDRFTNTIKGAGKQWLGGQLSGIGTTAQADIVNINSIRGARAERDNDYRLTSREEAERREAESVNKSRTKDGVNLRDMERRYSLEPKGNVSDNYRKIVKGTQSVVNKGDSLIESGTQDIEKAKEGATDFEKFLIDNGAQLTQWAGDASLRLIPVVGQALSMGGFFNRAGGMSAYQGRQEGMNPDQQFKYYAGSGLMEVLSELTFQSVGALRATYGKGMFSIADKLTTKASTSGIVRRLLNNTELGKSLFINMARLGGNAVEEGLEEVETDLVDPLLKYYIKKSEDPRAEFEGWDLKQMGYDFLMGATMGGVLGVAEVPNRVKYELNIANSDAFNDGMATSLIKQASVQGRQSDGGRLIPTNAEILAQQLQQQMDNNIPVQPAQIRMLQEAIGQSISENQKQLTRKMTQEYDKAQKSGDLVQMEGTRLESQGIDNASVKLVDEAVEKARQVIGENATQEDAEAVAGVTTGIASANEIDTVLAKPELKKAVETIVNEGADAESAVSIPVNNAEARDVLENLTAVKRIANRNTILKDVQAKNAEIIKSSVDTMSEGGKNLFASRAEFAQDTIGGNRDRNLEIYRDRFSRLYTDGNTKGADFETSYKRIIGSLDSEALKSVFTEDFARQIFEEGRNAIVTDTAKETAKSRAEEYANRKGGLTFENNNENLISSREKDELQKFAERVGVEINVVKSLSKDASGKALMSRTGKKLVVNGKYQDGVITIASDAQNKLITVAKHELTHHLKETSPEMYQKLEDFVFERWYHGNAEEMEDEIARYTKLYSGQGLDRDGVREEIIADASEAFFTDEGAIQDAISFSEKLGRAIHDGIKTMLDAFLGLQDADSRRMRGYGGFLKDLGILQEAERMWLEALEDTQQRKRNARGEATADDYVDASTQYTTSDEKHSLVENDEEIERLNSEPTQKSYRAMALIDGKLYPPMATRVKDGNGKWVLQQGADIGQWIKSDITTDHRMFNSKGQFLLKKDNGGSPLEVAYNPYIHSSDVMLNDQFASAHKRPNIVVVEGEIPRSELENGKRAEHDLDDGRHIKAKDPTGTVQWKAGVVQSHLTGTRTVFLTNHFKPTRVVPDSEVARSIQKMVAGTDVVIPYNVVTPSLRQELQKLGVKMEQSKQKGYQVDLNAKYSVTAEEDQAYMDAVNRGDMKTAQRMVDEQAKRNGYDIKAYHGTGQKFTKFDRSKQGSNFEGYLQYGNGFYFATSEKGAKAWGNFGKQYGGDNVMPVYLKADRMLDITQEAPDWAKQYLIENGYSEYEATFATSNSDRFLKTLLEGLHMSNQEVQDLLISKGYDGIKELYRYGTGQLVVFYPVQIKSADPVTYDDNGEVIPLSKRFTELTDDIRYSVSEGNEPKRRITEYSTGAYSGQVDMMMESYDGDDLVGYMQYSVYDNTPNIQYIHTNKKYRGQGVAREMLQRLQSHYPDTEINWGMTTPDGTKLKENVTYEVRDKKVTRKKKRLQSMKKEISENEKEMNDLWEKAENRDFTEEERSQMQSLGKRWDKLNRDIHNLEIELEDAHEVTYMVKMDDNAKFSLKESESEETETEKAINESMTMEQCKQMIQRCYNIGDIREWSDGEYKNGDEWIRAMGSEEVGMVAENDWSIQQKYLDKIDGILNEDFTVYDVLDAYLAGTLRGKEKSKPTRLDTSKGTGYKDSRFYSPQLVEDAVKALEVADQKMTAKNKAEVNKARAKVLLFAHNAGAEETLGLTRAELNKKLRSWSNYSSRARDISKRINANVAPENRWTGIENLSWLSRATVSNDELANLVKDIKGESSEYERSYIARTMLALDTHIDWTELSFEFRDIAIPDQRSVKGFYRDKERKIVVEHNRPNSLAHEMGHALDNKWGREISGTFGKGYALTSFTKASLNQIPNADVKKFANNFYLFMDEISDFCDIRSDYTGRNNEVFARFVDQFVRWTEKISTGRSAYSSFDYNDRFNQNHFIEFARLLQEKASLDARGLLNSTEDTSKFSVSEEDENAPTPKEYQSTIAKLEEKVADLKSEFKRTDLKTADPKQTRIQAGRLLKRHDSNLSIQNDVVDAFSKIHRLYKEKGLDAFDEASQIALETAKQVVDGIAIIHDEGMEQQKEIREFLKDNEIIISPYIEKNMDDFASFRKKNAFRLKLKKGEVSNLDKYIYPRLQELFPTAFPDEYYKANNKEGGENTDVLVDMLRHIGDVLDNPMYTVETITESTPEWKEYVSDIASDIMETAYGLQTKKTFADKKYLEKQKAVQEAYRKAREEALASRDRALAKQAERYETKISYLKQRNKDFKEETYERAEKKRRITQIAGIHKRLLEKLDTPKDTKHLPDGYAPIVSNVLSMFDFTTEGMEKWAERYGEPSKRYRYLDELRKRLSDMSKEDSPIAESGFEIDPDIIEIIEELKADVADTDRLSDLDSATLEDIYTLFKAFEHQLNTFNKAFDENNRQTVIENRDNFINETRDKKTRKDKQGTIGWLQRQLETNNTTPEDFFHLIGGTPEKLYKSIRKGFDKHILNVKSAMDFIKATTEGKDVKKWSENVREYTTSFNETIKLTDAQLMSIYCLSKREQAQQHMYSENGGSGIVVVPQKVGKGLKAETLDRANVVVNSSDIQKWISQLSKEQIEVADQLQRYLSEDMSKLGNETSLKLYGYKKFTEKNYFPIQSSNDWLNSNFDFKGDSPVLKNTGMTKALNKHASNPIVIDDIFTVATKHISTMSLYNSLVPSLTDFQRFWNSKDKDHNTTVQKEFIRVYGEPAYKYVENFMGDLNGSYKRGFEVEGVDKLMSKYKQASIGLNLRVLFQQPTAVARAGAVMNPIYITKALGASTTTLKQNLKDMREHCPIALWKSWGFYNTDLARDMRSIMMDEKTISDNFSKAYGIADDLTWSVIFKAVRYEVEAQNKNLKVGSDKYWEKVNERASEVFDRTQVVDSPFHRSQNMRAKDNLSKMVTAFMAEPTKTYNMLKTELTLAKREIQSGQKAQGVKRASRVVQVFVTNALLVSASSAVIDALRGVGGSGDDDKDKNWFERFLAHWWTNTKDNINPLGLLPVFKDVQSVVQGYDVTRMDMQAIGRMVKSLQYMGEYIKEPENSKYTFKNEAHYLLQQSAYLVGLPLANLERDTRGIAFSLAEAVGYDDLFFEEAKFKYQVNDKTKSMWADMYLDAKYKGNTALAKKIKDYITSNDAVTEEYIEEREKKYKKDNKSASQQHAYDSSIQTLEASPIWNTSSEDNKEYYTGILENLSVGIENQSTEYVTKLAKNGLTNEQVILYKLALKKVDKPNKNGKLGGTPTNAEKEDAIRLLERYYNLTQAQKDTLMGK